MNETNRLLEASNFLVPQNNQTNDTKETLKTPKESKESNKQLTQSHLNKISLNLNDSASDLIMDSRESLAGLSE